MEQLIVCGGKKLNGSVNISSAKNSVLVLMSAAILADEPIVITDCPNISDLKVMADLLRKCNCKVVCSNGNVTISGGNGITGDVDAFLSCKLRASVFLLGSLLAKVGRVKLPHSGGCSIGSRPIDLHIAVLKAMGAKVEENAEYVECVGLKSGDVEFSFPFASVGATENAIMAAVLRHGKTTLFNCAREPEIVDLQQFLNSIGGKISGAESGKIIIDGVSKLYGTRYRPVSDRIESGTFLLATAICGGEINIFNANSQNISALINKMGNNACKITAENDIINIKSKGKLCLPSKVITAPYPGFPTDLQSPFMSAALFAKHDMEITETLFENRFGNVNELRKTGAEITVNGDTAHIKAGKKLHAADMVAGDLRGGAGLVLAALGINGTSRISGVEYIDRGYAEFTEKLSRLGADIKRINTI